ncbi:hypothetical protein BH10PSE18_BH10PSE18_47910 [soil metagenome]
MALQIVAGTPGLWRDPQWAPEMHGLYALVVGASHYPYFKDGGIAATDSFDMGQLVSSAGTAAETFEWLRDSFRHRDLPLVWCQLLLSPTEKERTELDQRGLTHYAPPTHANLRDAIDRWTGNVPATGAAADRSRTFFFFSGHGVQTNWHPVLLPSDYLDPSPGKPKLENCVGVADLLTWMDRNPVAEHLALIDACRNEFPPLAAKGSTANTSFPTNAPGGKAPRTAASLSSTSPNAVAFQLPGRPRTFFGEAVLEALRSAMSGGDDARLAFRELVDYVKPRINALLQEAQPGTTLDQTARPRIEGDDTMVVTEMAARPSAALEGGRRAVTRAASPPRMRAPATAQVLKDTAGRFDARLAVPAPIALDVLRRDFAEIHRRFGHGYASHPWRDGMALYGLLDGQLVGADGSVVHGVQRNAASSLVQLNLSLAPRSGGVLLVFEGAQFVQRERLAVVLPTEPGGIVPIQLSLAFGRVEPSVQPRLLSIQARLGPLDQNEHYQYLWELTREAELGSLAEAAGRADSQRLKRAVGDKLQCPTAATAGVLLLARAGRIADVQDWARNLMNWFPEIPDCAVLWAESLRSAVEQGVHMPFGVAAPIDEMARALQQLGHGMPFFADTLELAESLLRHVLRHLREGPARGALLAIQQRLERLFQTAMPSGHFIVLPGLPRPTWLDSGTGALSVPEMRVLLGR